MGEGTRRVLLLKSLKVKNSCMCYFNFDSDISDYDEPICINLLGISLPCVLATFTKAQCSKTVVAKMNFRKF
jgi:hypothetical protein